MFPSQDTMARLTAMPEGESRTCCPRADTLVKVFTIRGRTIYFWPCQFPGRGRFSNKIPGNNRNLFPNGYFYV